MAIGGASGPRGRDQGLRLLVLLRSSIRAGEKRHAGARRADEAAVRQRLRLQDAGGALVVTLLFVAVILLSWIPFVALGYDPLDSLFEVVSAAGTVGLSTGICRPDLDLPLKAVLCGDMLLGRLEILAVVVLFYPGTWFGRRG
jgi:trk system potassium uptake protein TrkH